MYRILLMGLAIIGLATASAAALAAGALPPVGPGDSVLGSAKAPVTVIEYASLTCPHCARFENDIFPRIKTELIDTGKIRYVFRDFPLTNWRCRPRSSRNANRTATLASTRGCFRAR